jgi:hypothetical protein
MADALTPMLRGHVYRAELANTFAILVTGWSDPCVPEHLVAIYCNVYLRWQSYAGWWVGSPCEDALPTLGGSGGVASEIISWHQPGISRRVA